MDDTETALLRSQLLERRSRLEPFTLSGSADAAWLLRQIDAALERMDAGSYGLCASCHEPIERERLRSDPVLTLCLDHLNASQRRALEADLDLALRIQDALLPVRSMAGNGWQVYYHYEPAGPVSGDFCDLVRSSGERQGLFFLFGDVAGKGVAASLLMSHLHAIFRTLLSMATPAAELLERANRLFCESTAPSHYATLVGGFADSLGEVQFSNAGHCPPLLVRSGGITPLEATGLPLGLFCESRYETGRLRLDSGDSLVLYTDGLSEARNRQESEYGIERLARVLSGCHGQAPEAVVHACLVDLSAFLEGAPKPDDLTVMVLTRA